MGCKIEEFQQEQKKRMRAVQDSMDVLNGKWKISIISSICCYGKRRFSDILNDIEGISNRMLSKELKELEKGKIIDIQGKNTLVVAGLGLITADLPQGNDL